jgi:hypothetical protein
MVPSKQNVPRPIHVHFGAGPLGLGCTLPIFLDRHRLIVVQRGSKGDPMLTVQRSALKDLRVRIDTRNTASTPRILRFRILNGAEADAPDQLDRNDNDTLLFTDTKGLHAFSKTLARAVSFSTAVRDVAGQTAIINQLAEIGYDVPRPPVYLFENSHATERPDSLSVEPVIVDRICSLQGNVTADGVLVVSVEPYSNCICKRGLGWDEATWNIIENDLAFEFYRDRKKFLVNDTHEATAVIGFEYLRQKGFTPNDWTIQFVPVLIDAMHAPEFEDTMRTFLKIQAMRLVISRADALHKVYPMLSAEQIYRRLLMYSDEVNSRIRAVPDEVGRVFGTSPNATLGKSLASVADRVNKHFEPLLEWVELHREEINAFGALGSPNATEAVATARYLVRLAGELAGGMVRSRASAQPGKPTTVRSSG